MERNFPKQKPKSASLIQLYQYLSFQYLLILFIGILMSIVTGVGKNINLILIATIFRVLNLGTNLGMFTGRVEGQTNDHKVVSK